MREKHLDYNSPCTSLFGVPFDYVKLNNNYSDGNNVCQKIISLCNEYEENKISRHVVTVNMDFINNCFDFIPSQQNSLYKKYLLEILCSADLVVADGMPLVLMSRLLGTPLPERVTGADMVPALAELSSRLQQQCNAKNNHSNQNYKICKKETLKLYFLGGGRGVAEKAVANLENKYPYINVVGVQSPKIELVVFDAKRNSDNTKDNNSEQIINAINNSNADILFLALGNPKQEFWFHQHRDTIKVPVTIGVGGALDFLANKTHRAPLWVQNIGLEWSWRMMHDPKRLLKRYSIGFLKILTLGIPLIVGNTLCFFYARCIEYFEKVQKYIRGLFRLNGNKEYFSTKYNKNFYYKIEKNNNNQNFVFYMPKIINRDLLDDIEKKLVFYSDQGVYKIENDCIIFNMKKTLYINTSSLSRLIRLFFTIKKKQKENRLVNQEYTSHTKLFLLINLRLPLIFLLWCTGAYASLRSAIQYNKEHL